MKFTAKCPVFAEHLANTFKSNKFRKRPDRNKTDNFSFLMKCVVNNWPHQSRQEKEAKVFKEKYQNKNILKSCKSRVMFKKKSGRFDKHDYGGS